MDVKLSVYRILSDVCLHFKPFHLDCILAMISELAPHEIIEEEVELVYEFQRFSVRSTLFSNRVKEFYWLIITDTASLYGAEVVNLSITKYCDVMKSWDLKNERINVLYQCLENIERVGIVSSINNICKYRELLSFHLSLC